MSTSTTIRKTTTTSGPASDVKTYSTESRTTYETDHEVVKHYRPIMGQRTTIIQRSAYGGPQQSMSRSMSYGQNYAMGAPAGSYSNVTTAGVASVKTSRDKEKKDMQDLNERFASYIEKVRFLEAQNRKLADELDRLKSKWGKETTAIKAMYQAELDEARQLLDASEKEKAKLEIRCASLEEQIDELRQKVEDLEAHRITDRETIERQNQQLSEYEAEINVLRRRIEQLENDRERDKKEIARLTEALNRARVDLDNETLAHIDAENRRQTLEEELEFLKQIHEQEMKELAALAYRDTTQENREFWKNEMGNALREIQATYDEKLDAMRAEMETYYNLKLQEFRTGATRQTMDTVHAKEESKRLRNQLAELRSKIADLEARNAQLEKELEMLRREYEEKEREWETENTELKNEVAKLRAEMEAILKELQDLMDTKLGLELEIAAYRKLLEGEENRIGLRQVVESMLSTQEQRIQQAQGTMSYYSETASRSVSGSGSASAGGGSSSMMGGGSSTMMSGGSSQMSGGSSMMGGSQMSAQMQNQMQQQMQSMQSGSTVSDSSLKVSQVVKGEMSAKTTYQRSAKGPVAISECAADGKYIIIENTGRKPEDLGNWKIQRTVDGNTKVNQALPGGFTINAGQKVRIVSRNNKQSGQDVELRDIDSFGIGANVTTKLVSPAGEDRATHIQKTVYT